MCIRDRYDGGEGRRYAFAIYDKSFIGTYGLEKIYQRAPLVDFPAEYIIDNYVAVSYTHLDVYKRQSRHRAKHARQKA